MEQCLSQASIGICGSMKVVGAIGVNVESKLTHPFRNERSSLAVL